MHRAAQADLAAARRRRQGAALAAAVRCGDDSERATDDEYDGEGANARQPSARSRYLLCAVTRSGDGRSFDRLLPVVSRGLTTPALSCARAARAGVGGRAGG